MNRPTRKFWKTLGSSFLALAGVVGSYITAASVGAVWAFWVVGVGAIAYTVSVVLAPRAYKRSVEYTNRVTNYPRLLDLNVKLKEENEGLLAQVERKAVEKGDEYENAVQEGIRKAMGIVGAYSADVPQLSSVMKDLGGIVLVAHCSGNPPQPGSRYLVTLKLSNSIKGLVEVRREGHSSRSVQLVCVKPIDEDFWLLMAEKAELEESLPPSVRLVKYRLEGSAELPNVDDYINEESAE